MNHIKALVFDFGNVILDIDIPRTEGQLSAMAGKNWGKAKEYFKSIDLYNRYEVGAIEEDEFIAALRTGIGIEVSDAILVDAWNAMLLQLPRPRLQLLEALRKNYQVYLLSNTNQTHLNWVKRHLDYKFDITQFESTFFDKAYYSHQIGCRKPDNIIFDFVQTDANLDLSCTLFFDDLPENIEAAKAAGWNAILHNPQRDISEHLAELGISFTL